MRGTLTFRQQTLPEILKTLRRYYSCNIELRDTTSKVKLTGTHDNNTCVGWYASTSEHARDHFRRYLWSDGKAPHWAMINAAFKAHAKIAVVAMQDILGLGEEARFNEPGTSQKNWQWRMTEEQLAEAERDHAKTLRDLAELSGRAF